MRRAAELASVVAGGIALGAAGLFKLVSYADDVHPDWPGIGPLVFVVSVVAMRLVLALQRRAARLYAGPVLGGALAGALIGAVLGAHGYMVHGPYSDTTVREHAIEGGFLGVLAGTLVGIAATPIAALARDWESAGSASAVSSKPLFVSGCVLGGVALPVVVWQTFGAPGRGLEGFVLMLMSVVALLGSRFTRDEVPPGPPAQGPFRGATVSVPARASRRGTFAVLAAVVLLVAMPGLACVHVAWGDHAQHRDDETPRLVPDLDGSVRAIAVATDVACAHLADRTVRCWGDRAGKVVGDGGWDAERRPRARAGIGSVDRMALTEERMCVIRESGKTRALCWGVSREAGRETDLVPTEVGPPRAREIALAPSFSVALADDGTVWRWGRSSRTALGQVEGLVDVVAIAVGNARACALDRGGVVRCWDDGMNPEPMAELPGKADRIAMGPDLIAAHIAADDVWWAWGKAYDVAARSLRPVAPHELENSRGARSVFLAPLDVCVVTQTGAVSCSNWRDASLHVVLEGASAVAGHDNRVCAVTPAGVKCWRKR